MIQAIQRLSLRVSAAGVTALVCAPAALAQLFGPVPDIGANAPDIRVTVLRIIKKVLTFMALAAVVFVVIAGIRLIFSQGEDDAKEKAKKTIIFVIAGLIVIILAQAIVDFVINQLTQP
jgi:type IV secretory pathway VirB2 component (pilin)